MEQQQRTSTRELHAFLKKEAKKKEEGYDGRDMCIEISKGVIGLV